MSDKKTYDHALTRDPIEPDYDGGRIVGKLFLNEDNPVLVSQARGGATYQLLPEADKSGVTRISIEYSPERNAQFIDECITQMHQTGVFFRSGMTIVHVRNGRADPVSEPRLAYELSKLVLPYQVKTTRLGETRSTIRFDRNLLGQIMEVAPDRLPVLNGFADHPLLLPDGSLITKPGYDAASGLFILNGAARFPPIYSEPTEAQLKEAVATCMKPFQGYHFDDDFGMTATIFAVMLAVLRPLFSFSPMIVTTTLKTGVGKGYLQQALAIIRTGAMPELRNIERKNLSEFRKTLFTLLYESNCVIALDNMDGVVNNETLSSFITAPVWSDRILGLSKSGGALRNDALLLLNGCRVELGKNIARKVLRIGLTEAGEGHRFRDFGFLPHKEALSTRKNIIAAVLTIASHAQRCSRPQGTIGSFEEVNDLIRVPLADIAARLPELGLRDPLGLFEATVENDVDSPEEADIFAHIHDAMEDTEFSSRELRQKMWTYMTLEAAFKEFSATSPTLSAHSVGAILNQLRDEPRGGLILRARKLGGKNLWRIEEVK
ncbi:hypothetical protein [Primorskyibacter sp. S187A]|uniref:hypothetical protein n=1 Tax=Primorskyibacter sp. S187A TaxID=3415130 RepID=UPI003C7CF458